MILSRLHLWSSVKPLFIRLRQSRRVAIDKSIPINVFFITGDQRHSQLGVRH